MALRLVKKIISENSGFTLIESLVAMSIFVIAVIGLIGSLSVFMYTPKSDELQEAFIILQNEMIVHQSLQNESYPVRQFIVEKSVSKKEDYSDVKWTISRNDGKNKILVNLSQIVNE